MLKIIISYRMANNNRRLRIALVGYGKMGQNIATIARERFHVVETIIDPRIDSADVSNAGSSVKKSRSLAGAGLQKESTDVIIDFSTAWAIKQNIDTYCALGIPVVIGTTGWVFMEIDTSKGGMVAETAGNVIPRQLQTTGIPCVYGSNFSIGVYLFSELVAFAAEKLNALPEYDIALCEYHHRHKKDSPSGTALSIAQRIIEKSERKTRKATDLTAHAPADDELSVGSVRAGAIPGTHQVIIDSTVDSIELTHRARSRIGFAFGAVIAAEWITQEGRQTGVYTEKDVFNDILERQS